MKNIFKSYIKLFIKSWVETIGTIVFLLIFTMVVLGMLATPLQLTAKASSLKAKTNKWDQQMQYNSRFDEEFLYNNIYEGEAFSINYLDQDIKLLESQSGGWFTEPAKAIIVDYANYRVTEEIDSSSNSEDDNSTELRIVNEEIEETETIKRSAISDITDFFIRAYRRNGSDVELSINVGEDEPKTIKTGKIFIPEFLQNSNGYNNESSLRNLQSYLINNALNLMASNEKDAGYAIFNRLEINTAVGIDNYNYRIESYNPTLSNSNGQNLNNLIVEEGPKTLEAYDESTNIFDAYINDLYADSHNLKIGDTFSIKAEEPALNIEFRIVGIANKYTTIAPAGMSLFDSIDNYAQIFVDQSFFREDILFEKILNTEYISSNSFSYNQDRYIKNFSTNLNKFFTTTGEKSSIFSPGTSAFQDMKDHRQIAALVNLEIMTWIFLVIGSILLFLSFFFITFVLKKEINSTRKQLGVFKAMGYRTGELTWIFAVKTFITMFVGIVLGYIASIPFQIDAAQNTYRSMIIFNYDTVYLNPIFLLIIFIGIPALFAAVAYITIFRYLNEGALQLLSSGPKEKKPWMIYVAYVLFLPSFIFIGINKLILWIGRKRGIGFTYRMQDSFVQFSKGKYVLIMTLIGFSAFLFSLQLRAMPVINDMINGGFNFFTSKVDHMYDIETTSKLKFDKDDRLVYNDSNKMPEIAYIDYSQYETVENYMKNSNQFTDYDDINRIFTVIAEARDLAITKLDESDPNTQSLKTIIPIVSNMAALLMPLDSQINTEQVMSWYMNYDLFINQTNIWKRDSQIRNVLTLQNPQNNKFSGFWLSDFAKYSCFSTDVGFANCNDVGAYQNYLLTTNRAQSKLDSNIDAAISPIFSALLQEVYLKDFTRDQFISSNAILYNSKTDAFAFETPYFIEGNSKVGDSSAITAMDFKSDIYGDPRTIFNLSSVSSNQIDELTQNNGTYINGLVSYRLAKLLNLQVGDMFDINLGNKGKQVLKVRIAAINEAANMTQSIWFDYDTLLKQIGSEDLVTLKPQFTELYSTRESLTGEFDIKNIQNAARTFKSKLESTALLSQNEHSWLGSILDIYSQFIMEIDPSSESIPGEVKPLVEWLQTQFGEQNFIKDDKLNYFMDGNAFNGKITVLPLIKSAIDSLTSAMTKSMLMYIMIDILLLTILLVVIMNIIVRDAVNIITIMRSLGYSDRKINWMVMGRYIIGSAIAFVTAYLGSILTWNIIQMIVWSEFTVLVTIPVVPWLPFASFASIGGILFIGWLAAMYQIKKQPLTYLVS